MENQEWHNNANQDGTQSRIKSAVRKTARILRHLSISTSMNEPKCLFKIISTSLIDEMFGRRDSYHSAFMNYANPIADFLCKMHTMLTKSWSAPTDDCANKLRTAYWQ